MKKVIVNIIFFHYGFLYGGVNTIFLGNLLFL